MQGLSNEERRNLLLSVGSHKGRRPLSPIEVGVAIEKAISAGMTPDSLAEALHLDGPTMIGRFRRLLSLADDIQHLVDWGASGGTLGFSAAYELSGLPSKEQQALLAEACLKHGLTSSEARQIVQLVRRTKRKVAECVAEVVGMRPTVEIRRVYIGAILDEELKTELRRRTQAERNALLEEALGALFPEAHFTVAKLGADRFTLVGGDDVADVIAGDVERQVNEELKKRSTR